MQEVFDKMVGIKAVSTLKTVHLTPHLDSETTNVMHIHGSAVYNGGAKLRGSHETAFKRKPRRRGRRRYHEWHVSGG